MNGVIGEFKSVPRVELLLKNYEPTSVPRYYCLRDGDIIVVNSVGFENCFGMKIKDINLGDQRFDPNFICVEKIRRKKWWQFWKPKYVAARLKYVEAQNETILQN